MNVVPLHAGRTLHLQESVEPRIDCRQTKALELTWRQLSERLTNKPNPSSETFAEFQQWKLNKDPRATARKAGAGYYIKGPLDEARYKESGRGRMPSRVEIIVLDFDLPPLAWPELLKEAFPFSWIAHTTASHSPDKPKVRVVAPLIEPITLPESKALTHLLFSRVGWWHGIGESLRPNQPMFFPTVSSDQAFSSINHDAESRPWLDGKQELADEFGEDGGWQDPSQWAVIPAEFLEESRKQSAAATRARLDTGATQLQSPFEKSGTPGAFTQTLSIEAAIDRFLPGKYEPGSVPDRMTYVEGSNINGVWLVDYYDELGGHSAVINFHESDYTGNTFGQPMNVYDWLAQQLFNGLDASGRTKAMRELCDSHDDLKLARLRGRPENYGAHVVVNPELDKTAHPGEVVSEENTASVNNISNLQPEVKVNSDSARAGGQQTKCLPGRNPHAPGSEISRNSWLTMTLQTTASDRPALLSSGYNFDLLCRYCPEWNCFARDLFTGKMVCTETVDIGLNRYEKGQVIDSVTDLSVALLGFAETNYITGPCNLLSWDKRMCEWLVRDQPNAPHAWRDWLLALPSWDGVKRLEYVLPRYLQTAATEYEKTVSQLLFLGPVARAMVPGQKWDYVVVISGQKQGSGKSSLLRLMLPDSSWFSDNITWKDLSSSKKVVEEMAATALVEIGEMYQFEKDQEANKAAISRQVDTARPAYAREVVSRPRNFVVVGTTNKPNFLVDSQNRRYLTVISHKTTNWNAEEESQLEADRLQLFAEAMALYHVYCDDRGVFNYAPSQTFNELQEQSNEEVIDDDKSEFLERVLEILREKCITSPPGLELASYTCTKEIFELLHKQDSERLRLSGNYIDTTEGRNTFRVESKKIGSALQECGYKQSGRIMFDSQHIRMERFKRSRKWLRSS